MPLLPTPLFRRREERSRCARIPRKALCVWRYGATVLLANVVRDQRGNASTEVLKGPDDARGFCPQNGSLVFDGPVTT
jgi:hypothetical protein